LDPFDGIQSRIQLTERIQDTYSYIIWHVLLDSLYTTTPRNSKSKSIAAEK
jgi:hypothetical protein